MNYSKNNRKIVYTEKDQILINKAVTWIFISVISALLAIAGFSASNVIARVERLEENQKEIYIMKTYLRTIQEDIKEIKEGCCEN